MTLIVALWKNLSKGFTFEVFTFFTHLNKKPVSKLSIVKGFKEIKMQLMFATQQV